MSFGCDSILPALLGKVWDFLFCEIDLSQYRIIANKANFNFCEIDLSQYRS